MSTLYHLAAAQMLLYGAMWACAWVIVGDERRAVQHWLGFTLLLAAGLGLISLRPDGNPWLTVVLANWALVVAVVLFWRGGALFLRLPPRDAEMALLLLAIGTLVVWLGPQPRQGFWLHPGFVCAGAIGWLLLANARRSHAALKMQFGERTAWVVSATLSALALLQVVRAVQGLTSSTPVPMHQTHAANVALVFAMLVSSAVLNMVYLFLMVLRLLRRLTHLVDHDALTGLLNRRSIERALVRAWVGWRRSGRTFAVVSIDLDHFKQVNDRWGHPAGDEVLRACAELLQRGVRQVDQVGRVGGEEFLILLLDSDEAQAMATAERLRSQLACTDIRTHGALLRVTCSMGVAVADAGDAEPDQMVQRSDAALYQAKHDGRDRVVSGALVATIPVPAASPTER
ncbi:GGDEF domain-containing protein [Sphaerotilus microaerophilus]|uniref:diguanylate cyclase n=1 Tax=Sphaerotilus microaerophilus TaxID=2914710 RepID=A0ABM7YJL4_9BURK|nr:GGDEF domain-containing protein [Sphaerotilus sp. FB-5]BDI04528.1 hypothetical protein CATMQ487_14980 [Sphaerotilus sp. FB-5]